VTVANVVDRAFNDPPGRRDPEAAMLLRVFGLSKAFPEKIAAHGDENRRHGASRNYVDGHWHARGQ